MKERLGRGGMGVVFKVFDSELGQDVALKSLNRLSADDLYYLKNEFRSLADIRHPNLVDLHELFANDRECFFTMELVSGTDFVSYAREGTGEGATTTDWAKLHDASRQLALAISALHAAGKLHRDIKPSNVLVSRTGRVVLLDFGLVAPLSREQKTSASGNLVGTIEYMSPEQAKGDALGAAADWYSFGATLFEAATGRLPLARPLQWLLGDPRETGPERVRPHAPDAPEELDELVASLLSRWAERRPSGSDVLRHYAASAVTIAVPSVPAPARWTQPFEGRETEMSRLGEALDRARCGKPIVVRLHGPSGIGKSEIGRRFAERAEAAGVVVLRGRCHPQESVAFNALDGAVDDLSRWLERLPGGEAMSVLPRHTNVLPRLFPVLGRVPAIADVPPPKGDESGFDAFLRATRAFKELLARIADRRPVLVWIDDAQWGDEDSGKLLCELLRPPEAPALALLLSYRTEDRESSGVLRALDSEIGTRTEGAMDIPLGPLSPEQTRTLVERLLGDRFGAQPGHLQKLALESEGLPFFVHELARFLVEAESSDASVPSRLRLGDMLQYRMAHLPDDERRLLAVVSVAGSPLEQRLVLRAAGLGDAARQSLSALERACLVRSTTVDADRRIEIYHHRIRDAAMSLIPDDERREHHVHVADAMLTVATPALQRVVEHYEAAGNMAGVRRYVVAAAQQSAAALAFDRSAQLYRHAIAVGDTELGEVDLHGRLGDVLANAGRGRDAGRAFEHAADLASRSGASSDRLLFFRKHAAEQYLQSGQREDATRALATVLAPLGIKLPKSQRDALRRLFMNRARLAVRGLDFERRSESDIPETTLYRLDILLVLMQSYSYANHTYGIAFGSQLLIDALEVGEPTRIIQGLSAEAASWSVVPGKLARRQTEKLLELLGRLCETDGDHVTMAGYRQVHGMAQWFSGEFAEAARLLDAASVVFLEPRKGMAFAAANNQIFKLPAFVWLGRMRQALKELEHDLARAEARGDDFLIATCAAGQPSLAWLAVDQPDVALKWSARVLASAAPGFSTQHYHDLLTRTHVDLYRGEGRTASRRMEGAWPSLRENHYLSLSYVRDELRHLRARAALAAAAETNDATRAQLLSIVRSEAQAIEKHRLPFAPGVAALLRAGLANLEGDLVSAKKLLEDAIPELERCEMNLYREAARYQLGRLRGDTASGTDLVSSSESGMREQGVVRPDAMVRMFVPGFAS